MILNKDYKLINEKGQNIKALEGLDVFLTQEELKESYEKEDLIS